MDRKKYWGLFVLALGAVSTLPGCVGETDEVEWEEIAEIQQNVLDGDVSDPWAFAAVRLSNGCSGTAIHDNWVLTAGHCFKNGKDPSDYTVSYKNETRNITHVLVHPSADEYTGSGSTDIDAALIRLESPFPDLAIQANVPIWTSDTDNLIGTTVFCGGYGGNDLGAQCTTNAQCNAGESCNWGICMDFDTQFRRATFTTEANSTNPDLYYDLVVKNSSGQMMLPGDSGGACWNGSTVVGIQSQGNLSGQLGWTEDWNKQVSGEAFGSWAVSKRACDRGFDPNAFDWGYCSSSCPCDVGEGDCDSNSQCRSGLACGSNNGDDYGLPNTADVCEAPTSCANFDVNNSSTSFCDDSDCPCLVGEGDCDTDFHCGGGLVCRHNVGAAVGLPAHWDICEHPTSPGCPAYEPGVADANRCNDPNCSCGLGEGDCDNDSHCRGNLICSHNVGASYGLPSNYDVCTMP